MCTCLDSRTACCVQSAAMSSKTACCSSGISSCLCSPETLTHDLIDARGLVVHVGFSEHGTMRFGSTLQGLASSCQNTAGSYSAWSKYCTWTRSIHDAQARDSLQFMRFLRPCVAIRRSLHCSCIAAMPVQSIRNLQCSVACKSGIGSSKQV